MENAYAKQNKNTGQETLLYWFFTYHTSFIIFAFAENLGFQSER